MMNKRISSVDANGHRTFFPNTRISIERVRPSVVLILFSFFFFRNYRGILFRSLTVYFEAPFSLYAVFLISSFALLRVKLIFYPLCRDKIERRD